MTVSPSSVSILHTYLTEDPAKVAKCHRLKGRLYDVASLALFLGSVAIFGGVLAMYLGFFGAASVSLETVGLTCLVVGGCFLSTAYCMSASDEQKRFAIRNELLNTCFQNIKNDTENDVRQFYKDKRLSIEQIPTETMTKLRQINPEQPLKALIPLIARYQASEKSAKKWNARLSELDARRKKTEQDPELFPAEKNDQLSEQQDHEAEAVDEALYYNAMHTKCAKFTGLPNTIPENVRIQILMKGLFKHA